MARLNAPLPIYGLNVAAPAEYLDVRQSSGAQNVEVNRSVLRKRMGTAALGTGLGEKVMAIRELSIGEFGYTLRIGPTKTELLSKITDTWADVNHAPWSGSDMDRFDFAYPILSGAKIMTITNGYDPIRKYTGTGNTALLGGTPPLARFMTAYKSYLLLGHIIDGGTTFGFRVQWCDTGNPEAWTGGNAGSVNLIDDGLDITGIGLFGDYVAVHKESAIYLGYLVDTSSVFQFDRRATGIGAVAHATIQNLQTGEQIFLGRDGIRLFNGNTAPLIDSPLMDEIREGMNPEHAYRACSLVVRELDEYWVGVPMGDQTEPETVYKYNYRTGRAWKDVRNGLTCMSLYERADEPTWDETEDSWDAQTLRWDDVINQALNPVPLFGDEDGNVTRRQITYNDNGTAIDAYWDSKDFTAQDLGSQDIGRLIEWTGMQMWALGSGVSVSYSTDGGTTWTLVETKTLDGDYPADDAPDYVYFHVVSSRIRFRFRNAVAGETFTLKQFSVTAAPRGMRE